MRWICQTYDLSLPIRRTKSLADTTCGVSHVLILVIDDDMLLHWDFHLNQSISLIIVHVNKARLAASNGLLITTMIISVLENWTTVRVY